MNKPRRHQNIKQESIWKDLSKSVFLTRSETKYESTQRNGIKLFPFQSFTGQLNLFSWFRSILYVSLLQQSSSLINKLFPPLSLCCFSAIAPAFCLSTTSCFFQLLFFLDLLLLSRPIQVYRQLRPHFVHLFPPNQGHIIS